MHVHAWCVLYRTNWQERIVFKIQSKNERVTWCWTSHRKETSTTIIKSSLKETACSSECLTKLILLQLQCICALLHLGGMIFEQQRQRDVKKKILPPPKVVDFQRNSRYADIISKGREIFFKEETDDISNYCLCGPSGIPFEVDSKDWVLDSFLKLHNFQPSRLRLYVMHTVEVSKYESYVHGLKFIL